MRTPLAKTPSGMLAVLIVTGCTGASEPDPAPSPATASGAGGTTTASPLPAAGAPAAAGSGGTTPPAMPPAGAPTSTGEPPPGQAPPVVVPPVTSGNTETPWCKVKAILDKNCVACHATPAAGGAPFPLTTHSELTAQHPTRLGAKIYERVRVRVHADQSQAEGLVVMPPGRPLAATETALIDAWVNAGAPAGENPACIPPGGVAPPSGDPGTAEAEWPLEECDAVYKIVAHGAGGVDSPAMAPPAQESHPQVAWDAPWGDEEVQAIAFKSITDNRPILHHWILNGRPGGFLTGWAPGEDGIKKMRPDVGMLMPTGKGSLTLDMHYFNNGTQAEPDNSGVEVCVVKKEHFRKNNAAVATNLTSLLISIPPNSQHEVKASCTVTGTTPVTLLSASPHAHKLAVRMLFTVKKRNGQLITMHDMPFVFGDQKSYALDPPIVIESGDVIDTSCFYANTTNRTVRFGESTNDEMCFNFALYYPAGALKCGGGLLGL